MGLRDWVRFRLEGIMRGSMCCCGEVCKMWESPLWKMICWSVLAMERLQEQGGIIWVYEILGWHTKLYTTKLPDTLFVLSALPELSDYWNCLWIVYPTAGESVTAPCRLGSECLSVRVALSSCDHENSIVQWSDNGPHRAAVTLVSLVLAM